MKLIKLSENFYIITDDTQIKLGDWVYDTNEDWQEGSRIIEQANHTLYLDPRCGYKKITHSTQPIEEWKSVSYGGDGTIRKKIYDKIKPLSLQDVKELFGLVDVEKSMWYERNLQNPYSSDSPSNTGFKKGFELGYNQALEDNKERKYTERDMIETYLRGATDCHNKCIERNWKGVELNVNTDLLNELAIKHIKSIQPKKEWEVEFSNGKLKLK